MSSFNSKPSFENLMLQTLMGRLNIRGPPQPTTAQHPLISQSFEDLLLSAAYNLSSEDDNDDEDHSKTQLAREESKLEREIIKIILSGQTESLKPNSGQAVTIGEHHICVGFHEETESDYRVWEWHGHIMLFDEENGYTPEYIYGNYFERVPGGFAANKEEEGDKEEAEDKEEKVWNLGLKELIENGDVGRSRILHRNLAAPRRVNSVITLRLFIDLFRSQEKQLLRELYTSMTGRGKYLHLASSFMFTDMKGCYFWLVCPIVAICLGMGEWNEDARTRKRNQVVHIALRNPPLLCLCLLIRKLVYHLNIRKQKLIFFSLVEVLYAYMS